jgi:hypothetical protein
VDFGLKWTGKTVVWFFLNWNVTNVPFCYFSLVTTSRRGFWTETDW